jgi:hypothetical protein
MNNNTINIAGAILSSNSKLALKELVKILGLKNKKLK